jgi:DNA mismatch repair protein MutS
MTCVTMKVKEWNDNIVFLHEVTPGAADRSYGIHVAKLAGLPDPVVRRAEEVLQALEEGREGHTPLAHIDELPLFGATAPKPKGSAVEEALKAVEPDTLSPKQALEVLYDLKRKLF